MRTENYNPSILEVDFARAFHEMSSQLSNHITGGKVVEVKSYPHLDNPQLTYRIKDEEGDLHEIVVQIIQRPDHFIS
ncbi:hypothetical protein [Pontibacter burrus]|uniref:Uncharacterized protein n=1 Tax=Pontibacter burrus TaxID=2704466 RepID=A0A6B3LWB9_9BACT|nr:hypothetical protein [Pontibacter burrus]NEM97880.1 hypothetical protein [Pontibacter burrus]